MIRGLHGLLYSSDADAARDFIKNKLQLPHTDVGEGWLIFDLPEGDLGIHPTEPGEQGGGHDVSFYCDDIQGTVRELKKRGVAFEQEPKDHGYGWVTYFAIPGGIRVQLYEPRYQKGASRPARPAKTRRAPKRGGAKAKVKGRAPAKKRPTRRARR